MLLLLKITVVPGFVAGVTLASRRWGHRVGGLLTALPVVAGPTLCFYAIEQGKQFAAKAAQGTLLGLVAVTVFAFVYAWSCTQTRWSLNLPDRWTDAIIFRLVGLPRRVTLGTPTYVL